MVNNLSMDSKRLIFKAFIALLFVSFFSAFAPSLLHSQGNNPLVTEIETRSTSKEITVSWKLPSQTKGFHITGLEIYRNTKPIEKISDIEGKKPLAILPFSSTSYCDKVKDLCDYYYAVVSLIEEGDYSSSGLFYDQELDKIEKKGEEKRFSLILPGVNASVQGCRKKNKSSKNTETDKKTENIREKVYSKGERREQPLPYTDIFGEGLYKESSINREKAEETLKLIGVFEKNSSKKLLEPHIFEEDIISPEGGDDFLLFEVLRTSFIQKNYIASVSALKRFLAQNRKKETCDRANFYLAQSFYYQGRYEEALKIFLPLQEVWPSLTRKWIDSCLELYSIPEM